ncbi:hypothetical protein DB30_01886 [Enhygromyxa salina]|uniref:Uncharacterized protein n=1 Tax=Enhygromyxa salina TaxID=215803 RepID=A0A0C2CW84_9BACT|nr:hypothetical protein [Enhygromyxa salina]KIG12122.1 hypothetical protein DB30_01886 [Enhygromyxa salina]
MLRCAWILLSSLLVLAPLGCAGTQAYVEWRPGLSPMDFDGTFEISLDEFDGYVDRAQGNTLFDRFHGESKSSAAQAMAELGSRTSVTPVVDPRGYSIVSLTQDANVGLQGEGGKLVTGPVDWFATTPDRSAAALLSGTKLAVSIGSASAGVDIGSLLGTGLGGYRFMLLVDDAELSVFALPEMGGVVSAYDPGFLFSFRHLPGARERWDITVARVSISM